MSIGAALSEARHRLEDAGIPDAAFEAELLMRHAVYRTSGDNTEAVGSQHAGTLRLEVPLVSRAFIFTHSPDVMSPEANTAFETLIDRRLRREPSAYIIGHREFYGLDFIVTPSTLIPRPETELLVEAAIELCGKLPDWYSPRVVDVGTGSGAIAIALAKTLPRALIWATDVSSEALSVARRNAERHNVERRIAYRRGDLLEPLDERFDVIVANLPYVAADLMPGLEPEVKDFEPSDALTDGADGRQLIGRLVQQSSRYLRPGGAILLEYGYGQTDALLTMAKSYFPEADIEVRKDLAGSDRVMTIRTT